MQQKRFPKTKKSKVYPNDDTQTVIYNDDVNLEDLTTVGYTSEVEIENLSDAEAVNCTNNNTANNVAQQQAKRIIKKHTHLKRKATKAFDETREKRKN